MPETRSWAITTECLWCSQPFVQIEIDHTLAWLCTTEACRERQLAFKITDIAGNLLFCPLPIQVEFAEAIASQKFGAICIGRSSLELEVHRPSHGNLSRGTPAERIHGVISAPRVEPDRREPNALC